VGNVLFHFELVLLLAIHQSSFEPSLPNLQTLGRAQHELLFVKFHVVVLVDFFHLSDELLKRVWLVGVLVRYLIKLLLYNIFDPSNSESSALELWSYDDACSTETVKADVNKVGSKSTLFWIIVLKNLKDLRVLVFGLVSLLARQSVVLGHINIKFLHFWIELLVIQTVVTKENFHWVVFAKTGYLKGDQAVWNHFNMCSTCNNCVTIICRQQVLQNHIDLSELLVCFREICFDV